MQSYTGLISYSLTLKKSVLQDPLRNISSSVWNNSEANVGGKLMHKLQLQLHLVCRQPCAENLHQFSSFSSIPDCMLHIEGTIHFPFFNSSTSFLLKTHKVRWWGITALHSERPPTAEEAPEEKHKRRNSPFPRTTWSLLFFCSGAAPGPRHLRLELF